MNNSDAIKLSFPVNPAYVSSARLTVSSITNRISFDIDEIEDIKTAVSEACIFIIKRSAAHSGSNFEIIFRPGDGAISVEITSNDFLDSNWNDAQEMSLMMIRALVDEFSITKPTKDSILITMTKKHKATTFD